MTTGGLANDQVSFLNSLLFLRIGRIGPCVRGKPKVERATDLLVRACLARLRSLDRADLSRPPAH